MAQLPERKLHAKDKKELITPYSDMLATAVLALSPATDSSKPVLAMATPQRK